MINTLQKIHSISLRNSVIYFRCVLFLTFLGHALVSLHCSVGYELHYRIFESVNYYHWNPETVLTILGWWDIFLAVTILLGVFPRFILSLALIYLGAVAVVGFLFYQVAADAVFGFAESFRRFAWIFYAVFLWVFFTYGQKRFSLLRVGIGFAFLAHGLASMGFFGLKGAHIELASQLFSQEVANNIVFYSGFSDTILGALILTGLFSRPSAIIGSVWLIVVVYLSFLVGIPEGIFRCGFLFSCIYVAMDSRCHTPIWRKGVVETAV